MPSAPRHPKPAGPRRPRRPKSADAAAQALLEAGPLVTRWAERLLAQGTPPLTMPQYLALTAIAAEPLSAVELARRTGVSGPAVSQLLAGLVSAGWVKRQAVSADRRRQDLLLTAAGQDVVDASRSALAARLIELFEDLPAPESDALARSLPFVTAALAGTPPPRRPHPHGPPHPLGPARPPRGPLH